MGLQDVGAGLGRTGTLSLKQALEQLLDGPCYHMMEVFGKRDAIETWHRAAEGDPPDWNDFLAIQEQLLFGITDKAESFEHFGTSVLTR